MKKTIGITKPDSDEKHKQYVNWITAKDPNVETITLSSMKNNRDEIDACDALILTGGIDVSPEYYNNSRKKYPGSPDIFNTSRDAFEMAVFNKAREKNLPILAICRGMQLVNCILKGDLIQDLEESGKANHSQIKNQDTVHEINVNRDSLLFSITNVEKGLVNSAHHQSLDRISEELMVSAYSPDHVPEAAEYRQKQNKPFFLCVQWHPERLLENENTRPFTKNIRESFLASIKK